MFVYSHFVIACKDKLTKWSTTTGDKVLSIVQDDGMIVIVFIIILLLLVGLS